MDEMVKEKIRDQVRGSWTTRAPFRTEKDRRPFCCTCTPLHVEVAVDITTERWKS